MENIFVTTAANLTATANDLAAAIKALEDKFDTIEDAARAAEKTVRNAENNPTTSDEEMERLYKELDEIAELHSYYMESIRKLKTLAELVEKAQGYASHPY